MGRVLAVTLCAALAAGCFKPLISDGTVECGEDARCPPGFECNDDDRRCYRIGAGPGDAGAGGDDALPPGDSARGDTARMGDLACTGPSCCLAPCPGLCMTCGADRVCDDVPADDPGCPTVDCDALDEPCRDFHDITTNRCDAIGLCKIASPAACTDFTMIADGMMCDDGDAGTDPDVCGQGICTGTTLGVGFTDVTTAMGVGADPDDLEDGAYAISWDDIDGDGDQDVYIGHGATLYINNLTNFTTYCTQCTGLMALDFSRPGYFADFDNDGDPDLFIRADMDTNLLLENDGMGAFTNIAVAAGVDFANNLGSVAWLDYDRDGDLDLFHPDSESMMYPSSVTEIQSNNGDRTFTEIEGPTIGLALTVHEGEVSSVADYDNDGDIDIWYGDQNGTGRLWRNEDNGTFTDESANAGLAIDLDDGTMTMTNIQPYLPASWGDCDNDGDLDVFMGMGSPNADRLYLNDGDGTFTLSTELNVDRGITRNAAWGDYDNDGDLDLFLGIEGGTNLLFSNDGTCAFTDVTAGVGVTGANSTRAVSFADYDNDGDLDLYIANVLEPHELWRNDLDDDHFLKVRPVGRGAGFSPRDGIGSRVELWNAAGDTLLAIREVSGGGNLGTQPPKTVHFGLSPLWGGPQGLYTVRVRFTSGAVVSLSGVRPVGVSLLVGMTNLPNTIEVLE